MDAKSFDLWLKVAIFMWVCSSSSTDAYNFVVGGKDGWVVNPTESYSHWAQRNRFQVNDTLDFGHKKGTDSVLVVKQEDYFSCNVEVPIKSLTEGKSLFLLNRSGPFFFIAGERNNCLNGQKLLVVVMAVRNQTQTHHGHHGGHGQSPSPSPAAKPAPSVSPAPIMPLPVVQPPVVAPASDLGAPAAAAPLVAQNSNSVGLGVSRLVSVFGTLVMSLVFGFVGL